MLLHSFPCSTISYTHLSSVECRSTTLIISQNIYSRFMPKIINVTVILYIIVFNRITASLPIWMLLPCNFAYRFFVFYITNITHVL